MFIRKIELYKYKRFFLSQVDHFVLEPKSNIMIIAWGNGKGKSSLLSCLNPLPADIKNDYKEDGYKYIEILHRGKEYIISSNKLEKGKHSFIVNDVELNPGGTKKVQLELVQQHFNITPAINEILLGNTRFTTMPYTVRKHWFSLLSTVDYTYAITVYNNLKNRHRDIAGGIKLTQVEITKLSSNVKSKEEIDKLTKDREILEKYISYITSLYVHTEDTNVDTSILDTLKSTVNTLNSNLDSSINSYKIEDYDKELYLLESNINNCNKQIESVNKQLSTLDDKLSNIDINTIDTNRRDIITKILNIRSNNKYKVNLYNIRNIYNKIDNGYKVIKEYLNELNDLTRVETSLEAIEALRIDLLAKEQHLQLANRKLNLYQSEYDTLSKFNTEDDITSCPNCNHKFHIHYDVNKIQILTDKIKAGITYIDTKSKEYTTLQQQYNTMLDTKRIIDNIKSLFKNDNELYSIYLDIQSNIDYNTNTVSILTLLDTYRNNLYSLLPFTELYTKLKELHYNKKKLLEIESIKRQYNISNYKLLEDELVNVTKTKNEYLKQHTDLLETKKKVIKIIDNYNRLKQLLKSIKHIYKRSILQERNKHYNLLIQELKSILVEYDQQLLQIHQSSNQIDKYSKQLEDYKQREKILSILLTKLSPSEGLIAKSINSFLNVYIQEMNHIINSIWSYNMELLPCEITDENDLDYKFKVRVNNDEVIEDISKLSSSMQEIVDLAFKIVFIKYMNLSDSPLILDEFGRTMDATHRDTAYNIIDRIFSTNFNQIFLVSHFESMYGRFINADMVTLDNETIT